MAQAQSCLYAEDPESGLQFLSARLPYLQLNATVEPRIVESNLVLSVVERMLAKGRRHFQRKKPIQVSEEQLREHLTPNETTQFDAVLKMLEMSIPGKILQLLCLDLAKKFGYRLYEERKVMDPSQRENGNAEKAEEEAEEEGNANEPPSTASSSLSKDVGDISASKEENEMPKESTLPSGGSTTGSSTDDGSQNEPPSAQVVAASDAPYMAYNDSFGTAAISETSSGDRYRNSYLKNEYPQLIFMPPEMRQDKRFAWRCIKQANPVMTEQEPMHPHAFMSIIETTVGNRRSRANVAESSFHGLASYKFVTVPHQASLCNAGLVAQYADSHAGNSNSLAAADGPRRTIHQQQPFSSPPVNAGKKISDSEYSKELFNTAVELLHKMFPEADSESLIVPVVSF